MSTPTLRTYVLSLADDALVAAQRTGEWIAAAPQIEEDVALGNIALDLLGQARSLLTYAGSLEDPARTEDELAYLRDAGEFRNVHLVERPRGDFGVAMARLLDEVDVAELALVAQVGQLVLGAAGAVQLTGPGEQDARLTEQVEAHVAEGHVLLDLRGTADPLAQPLGVDERVVAELERVGRDD